MMNGFRGIEKFWLGTWVEAQLSAVTYIDSLVNDGVSHWIE
jgi:hypothetical protein